MLVWAARNLFQLAVRLGFTLAGCITLQHVIQQEGYRCELSTLLVGAAVTIVVMRLWMPWGREARTPGE